MTLGGWFFFGFRMTTRWLMSPVVAFMIFVYCMADLRDDQERAEYFKKEFKKWLIGKRND